MNLDEELISAHQTHNLHRLVVLYQRAADEAFVRQDIDAGCFYLTHAYIFALEGNHPDSSAIHLRLMEYGRES